MPRETLNIEVFNKGLVTSVAEEDMTDAASSWGTKDLDSDSVEGTIRGRPGDTAVTSPSVSYLIDNIHATLQNSDATVDVVYKAGNTVRHCQSFPTGTDAQLVSNLENIKSMVIFGRSVRVGGWSASSGHLPRWIGETGAQQFGIALPTGRIATWAEVMARNDLTTAVVNVNSVVAGTTSGSLEEGGLFQYDVAYEYDGFQVTPLSMIGFEASAPVVTTTRSMDVEIILGNYANLSPRVTAVLLFRRQVSTTNYDQKVFVTRIDINDSGWAINGTDQEITVTDLGDTGPAFDDFAGFSETLTNPFVNYRLAALVTGYLVVGQCSFRSGDLSDDAPFMLFRSNANKPDMFDWPTYFCRLPNYPTALTAFQGRAYAFDAANIFRINPITMAIEDHIEGVGSLGNSAVLSNEYGMFFCDVNGIYMHNGSTLIPIGKAISSKWKELVTSSSVVSVRFHPQSRSVYFTIHGSSPVVFAYSVERQRWDYLDVSFTGTGNLSCIVGALGTLYMFKNNTGATAGVSIGTSSTRKGWTWVSKLFTFGTPTQYKRLYDIATNVRSGSSPTTTWSIDGGAYTSSLDVGEMAKTLRVKIVAATDITVESVVILFRRLLGLR